MVYLKLTLFLKPFADMNVVMKVMLDFLNAFKKSIYFFIFVLRYEKNKLASFFISLQTKHLYKNLRRLLKHEMKSMYVLLLGFEGLVWKNNKLSVVICDNPCTYM